ncbi:ankyrin repeat domain-containing protein [Paenibacillus flagellatus]|uniref:Uncharacterized protein n=1 Tax=Paenibacillus flagellatus TaxID=2211139 RepID=A0A2V5K7L6_9BACL|nr:ankyrin repeat domain-containing protein [Paenibacillus flagellatus]PYI53803.1 hypothetical protein DLM86_14695 [Paenibacillus flagellatus]
MRGPKILLLLIVLVLISAACSDKEERLPIDDAVKTNEKEKEISPSMGERLLAAATRHDTEQVRALMGTLETEAELNQALASVLNERHKYKYDQKEDVELVMQLLSKGADPNDTDRGEPILFLARTADLLKAFYEDKRTNRHAKTSNGATLLIAAIGGRSPERVDYLLTMGADPNEEAVLKDGELVVPLHDAIQYDDDLNIVKLLLRHPKIDLTKTNQESYTPLEWAKHLNKSEEVLQLVEAANASPNR